MANAIRENAGMRQNIFSAAFLAEKIMGNEGKFLFGVALITRIIALPFADIVEADAGARLFLADHAAHHGGALLSLQWPALQIHLLSLFQMLTGDRTLGPAIFDLLMGAGVVVPFYFFTKNIFDKTGAFYTALIFTFCPLVFRNAFLPLSEVYNLFFSVTALWCLSEGLLHPEKKIKWAILGGLAMTFACGGRFEAWILAGMMGILLLVAKQWKMFFAFGFASALYPVFWLVFCYLKSGDALISIHMVERQNFEITKVNAVEWTKAEYIQRVIFFPFSLMVTLTPVVAFIIAKMMFRVLRRLRQNPTQSYFLILFLSWLGYFIHQAWTGDRVLQHRFTLILIFLSLPFYALWFEHPGKMRLKKSISIIIVLLIIPWSFCWERLPWHWLGGGFYAPKQAIMRIIPSSYWEIQAVPRIKPRYFATISDSINANAKPGSGIFIDYCDWNPSSFLALNTDLPAEAILQEFDYSPHHGDHGYMLKFFEKYRQGQILLSDFSTLVPESHFHGPLLEFDSVPGGLLLQPVINDGHFRLFRYVYINAQEAGIQRQKYNLAEPLFRIEKDAEFYVVLNYRDAGWLGDTWIKSLGGLRGIDAQVHDNAKWMVEQDELKNKQENKPDSIPR